MKQFLIVIIALSSAIVLKAQDTALHPLPSKYLSQLSSRTEGLTRKLDKKSEKAIAQLQKQEEKIRRKLSRLDSSKAKELFNNAEEKYGTLKRKLENPSALQGYIPYLDTLKTSFKFLEQNKQLFGKVKDIDKSISGTADKMKGLEGSLAKAENVKAFIKERKEYLKQQLTNLPFSKEIKKLNKQAYYYAAQVNEYKETLKDSKKLERKAIELLSKTKAFQDFMRKNSQLASLFRLPGGDDPAAT